MIDAKLKDKILPHLKKQMAKEDYRYIDGMFDEVYETHKKGRTYVTLKPPINSNLGGFQFNKLTGTFHNIVNWRQIRRVGRRL